MSKDGVCLYDYESLAEKYRRMVSRTAWNVWRKLPPHTRIWLGVDDLIQDGMNWVITVGIPKYREDQASLCTFLYIGIENYIRSEYLCRAYQKTRYEGRTVSLDGLDLMGVDDVKYAVETRVPALRDTGSADMVLKGCWVVPMVVRVFKRATELLRRYLRIWFLRENRERIHVRKKMGPMSDGQLEFALARQEFLGLAKVERLEYGDCEHLLGSLFCQRELKFGLAAI